MVWRSGYYHSHCKCIYIPSCAGLSHPARMNMEAMRTCCYWNTTLFVESCHPDFLLPRENYRQTFLVNKRVPSRMLLQVRDETRGERRQGCWPYLWKAETLGALADQRETGLVSAQGCLCELLVLPFCLLCSYSTVRGSAAYGAACSFWVLRKDKATKLLIFIVQVCCSSKTRATLWSSKTNLLMFHCNVNQSRTWPARPVQTMLWNIRHE